MKRGPALSTRAAAGIFTFAFLLRLAHVWQIRVAPWFALEMGDAKSYSDWARRLAAGDWLGDTVFYQAPLYPYFLGTLYTILGDNKVAVLIAQSLLGAAASVVLAAACARLFSPPAGWVAGLLLAAYAPAIFFDSLIQKSVLDLFFLCLILWILSRILVPDADRDEPPRALWLALGAALGALILTRENAIVLAGVLLAWIFLARRSQEPLISRRRLARAGLLVVGLGTTLAPVALRNLAIGGELHLTTSQLGPNFYIGNHHGASGTYEPLRPGRGSFEYERLDATRIAERTTGQTLSPKQVSDYWTGRTIRDIQDHPSDWLKLLARKLYLAWNAAEIVDTEDQHTYADRSLTLRLAGYLGHFGVIVPLALIGLWSHRDHRALGLLSALLVAYLASIVLFYVVARYRYPLVPLLIPWAAAGLVALPRLLREPRLQRWALGMAAVGLAVVCNWPAVAKDEMRAVTALNVGQAWVDRGEPEAALEQFRNAVRLDPGEAMAHYNLGTLLRSRGDRAAAIEAFEKALELRPDYPAAAVNLGISLAESGDLDGAIRRFEAALQHQPEDPNLHVNLALALGPSGRIDLGLDHLERAIRIVPDDPAPRAHSGSLLAASGRYREARSRFLEALELDPDHVDGHLGLGLLDQAEGDLPAAAERLRAAVRAAPGHALAHNHLGNVLGALGDSNGAIHAYREVVRLEPVNAHGRTNLGRTLRRAGQGRPALAELREAQRLRPGWPPPAVEIAWILATDPDPELRDPLEAVRLAREAADRTGRRDPEPLDALAAALAALGSFDAAVATAGRALSLLEAAGDPRAAWVRQRLETYRRRQPYVVTVD